MAAEQPTVFHYKLIANRWSPVISVGIRFGQTWRPFQLFLDSGATYSILHHDVAADLAFEYQKGRRMLVQMGDGRMIPVFVHELPVQIARVRITAPVGFSSGLGVPFDLLGRLGIFEHYRICFHEKRRVVSFQPVG